MTNEIFYPLNQAGETSQHVVPDAGEEYEFEDVTDDENNDDFDSEPVLYHDPEKVKQIAALLNSISTERLLTQFNAEELNREKIYPCCWSNNKGDEQSFNENHISKDYHILKQLFKSASVTASYLLCLVG